MISVDTLGYLCIAINIHSYLASLEQMKLVLKSKDGICYFIFILRPNKSKLDYAMNLYKEFVVFLIIYIIGAYIYEDLPTHLYNITEWSLVVLIYGSIIIPALVNLILSIKDLLVFIKARYYTVLETQEKRYHYRCD
jgi:hypothetical protein